MVKFSEENQEVRKSSRERPYSESFWGELRTRAPFDRSVSARQR